MKITEKFEKAAERIAVALGTPWAFMFAVAVVFLYFVNESGEEWSMFISNAVMFWMLFIAQNSQNRELKAMQLKLDEIVFSLKETRNDFVAIEKSSAETLEKVEEKLVEEVQQEQNAPFGNR